MTCGLVRAIEIFCAQIDSFAMQRDGIDNHILQLLRQDGRMSNANLAQAVGLSPSACLRRLHLLEANGVIRGYTALIDDGDDDDRATIVVQITLEKQTEDCMRKFEAAVRKCPEVRECFLMGGEVDYWLVVETDGMGGYERVHAETLSRLPHVARIRSNFAIRRVIR